jgi:hypothetical protein
MILLLNNKFFEAINKENKYKRGIDKTETLYYESTQKQCIDKTLGKKLIN